MLVDWFIFKKRVFVKILTITHPTLLWQRRHLLSTSVHCTCVSVSGQYLGVYCNVKPSEHVQHKGALATL